MDKSGIETVLPSHKDNITFRSPRPPVAEFKEEGIRLVAGIGIHYWTNQSAVAKGRFLYYKHGL